VVGEALHGIRPSVLPRRPHLDLDKAATGSTDNHVVRTVTVAVAAGRSSVVLIIDRERGPNGFDNLVLVHPPTLDDDTHAGDVLHPEQVHAFVEPQLIDHGLPVLLACGQRDSPNRQSRDTEVHLQLRFEMRVAVAVEKLEVRRGRVAAASETMPELLDRLVRKCGRAPGRLKDGQADG
jgi:hypothetical protein